MRIRILVSMVSIFLLLVLIGSPTPQAQSQSLNTRESAWGARSIIGLPGGGGDDGDDELADTPAPVARTGQTISYFLGDDGELQEGVPWPCPRFTDNLDGTVTDHLTGLFWLKDATTFSGANWNTALSTCNDLGDDGVLLTDGSVAGDWRLPNNKELRGLIDFGNSNPALPDGHLFIIPNSGAFWTSTSATNNTGRAWTIEDATMVNDPKNTPNRIWPVRDPFDGEFGPAPVPRTGQVTSYGVRDDGELQMGVEWPVPRFTDNLDGTATDELTGLIWVIDTLPFAGLSFEDALAVCNALADDGVTLTDGSVAGDWRLPNIWELGSLNDFSEIGPALPEGHPFIVVNADSYWSSTTLETNDRRAWTVGMGIGRVTSLPKAGQNRAWPVRGGDDEYDDEYDDECDDESYDDGGIDWLPLEGLDRPGSANGSVDLMQTP